MKNFELLLFTCNEDMAHDAVSGGVDGIIIDWEFRGKSERQKGADTQINRDTLENLNRVRAATDGRIIVRINGFGPTTADEINLAIDAGAQEIMLPMVTTIEEVDKTFDLVRDRAQVGILIETLRAVEIADRLGRLPLRRVYVGLNDLAIQRRSSNIFTALTDGVVETALKNIARPIGFGGLTLPDLGSPLPCRLLIAEMARMRTHFSFLRRSFLSDVAGRSLSDAVFRIKTAMTAARNRTGAEIAVDRSDLITAVRTLNGERPPRHRIIVSSASGDTLQGRMAH